jgi:hypothetical protein
MPIAMARAVASATGVSGGAALTGGLYRGRTAVGRAGVLDTPSARWYQFPLAAGLPGTDNLGL